MAWADDNLPLGMEDLINDSYNNEYYTTIDLITVDYELKKVIVWEDHNGNVHHINEMSTEYIERCIKYIKTNNFRKIYLPLFEKELKRRQQQ